MDEEYAKFWIVYLLDAFNLLYKNKIVYCDFKLQNVVIDNDYKSQLIDFGFACKADTNFDLNVVNMALKYILLQKYFIK